VWACPSSSAPPSFFPPGLVVRRGSRGAIERRSWAASTAKTSAPPPSRAGDVSPDTLSPRRTADASSRLPGAVLDTIRSRAV
jgi:hypothetical protein